MVSPISSLGSGITPANRRGVTIKVRADTRAAEVDLGRLTRSVEGMSNKFSKMAASVKVAVAAIGGLAALSGATHGISRVSDSLTEMENRIALVTGRGDELNITLERLRRISASTRTSVASSADIYNRFGVALKNSNVSAADLFKVTEVLQKSIAISGSNAVSAEAALMQLGQAMSSGELRGEEFNSVNEQMSRVMIALENQLGKTRGELRAMAKDGQLTSDVVFKAILADAQNVNREFEQLDATTRSLAIVLGDEFKLAITNLDRAVGVSDSIRAKIRFITKGLQGFNKNFDSIALNVRVNVNRIQNYFAELSTSVQNYLRTTFGGSRWDGAFGGLKKAYGWVKTFINDIIELFKNAWDVIVGNSYWPEIFYEGSRSIAGSNTKGAMDVALGWIGSFIDKVIEWFGMGYRVVSQIWSNLGQAIQNQDFSFGVVFDKLDFVGEWLSWLRARTEEMASGMVIILSAMFRVGFKRALALGMAVAFAPDILNSSAVHESLKNFGRGIGKTLRFILSDGDTGKSIIRGITDSLKAFGEGIWEGLWPDAPFKNGFTNFLSGIFGTGIILLALKPALIKDTILALLAVGTSGRVIAAAKKLGSRLSRNISGKLRTSLKVGVGSALVYALSEASLGEGSSLGSRVASAALDVTMWATQGAAIGSMFGPAGTIGGLILGGILGALVGAFLALTRDGEILNDIGAWISETSSYYGQALVDGLHGAQDAVNEWFKGLWTSIRDAVVEGFKGATEAVSSWFKGMFSFGSGDLPNQSLPPSATTILPRSSSANSASDIEDYLKSVRGYNTGGRISGPGTGTSDSIPAMLSNGEFVIKASSVSKYGQGFLEMLNSGNLPKFATGGLVGGFNGNEIADLKVQLTQAEAERNSIVTKNKMMQLDDPGYIPQTTAHVDDSITALSERINYLSKQAAFNAEASTDVSGDIIVPGSSSSTGKKGKKKKDERPEFAEDISSSIAHALRTGDVKGAFEQLADSFTSRIIQDFSDGIADAIAGSIDFEGLFKDVKGLGSKLFENVDFGKMFSNLGDTLKNIFSGLGGLFSGGGGGGLFKFFGSFLGFDQGGMVPNIPGSQIGKDSVPALLKPGERVMSRSEVANRTVQGKGGMTTAKFDINVTGDVTRQTRREIMDMIPQIAQSVNAENRELNYQYR